MLGLGAALAASTMDSQAQPYYVAGGGLSPAWSPGDAGLQLAGSPLSVSVLTTVGAGNYHELKVTGATWSDPNYPANNVKVKADANGSNTFYFYPGSTVDGWSPVNNRVGYADPGNMTWEIIGGFANWSAATNLVSIGNGIYSNTITGITPGTYGFKFRTQGTWGEVAFGSDFGNFGSDGSFVVSSNTQVLPVVLDLPKGRWLIGTLAPPPVTNQVVFAVDMTYQKQLGLFHDGSGVFVAGAFNGWPGTGPGALVLTNDPPYNGGSNTNIWYATNTFVGSPGSVASEFKYTQNDGSALNGGWETSNNRSVTLGSSNGVVKLAVGVFSDLYSIDVLAVDTDVTFSVSMTNAVGTDAHVFDSANDLVFINGDFAGWPAWNPISLASQQCVNSPAGSQVYTFTRMFPAGSSRLVTYKYSINGNDDEAGFAQNHTRYIRSTNGVYAMPLDTFTVQYGEPKFGNLGIGAKTGGAFPLSWFGYPGVSLQTATNVAGPWVTVPNTDGGSSTNWPAGNGGRYFRLIQP